MTQISSYFQILVILIFFTASLGSWCDHEDPGCEPPKVSRRKNGYTPEGRGSKRKKRPTCKRKLNFDTTKAHEIQKTNYNN